jgi:hypothetical protein
MILPQSRASYAGMSRWGIPRESAVSQASSYWSGDTSFDEWIQNDSKKPMFWLRFSTGFRCLGGSLTMKWAQGCLIVNARSGSEIIGLLARLRVGMPLGVPSRRMRLCRTTRRQVWRA